jgi:titin
VNRSSSSTAPIPADPTAASCSTPARTAAPSGAFYSTNNVVAGNWIGLDADGDTPAGNGTGIWLTSTASDNTIGGPGALDRNVISGNDGVGIQIQGADNNTIIGNYIGTDRTGMFARENWWDGIWILDNGGDAAVGNIIGGFAPADRNVISGNRFSGIYIENSDNNFVRGNYIGVDATGANALGNGTGGFDGIEILHGVGNVIGGSASGAGNVISGNVSDGVSIWGGLSTGNRVLGNYIGTNSTGTLKVANGGNGVSIEFDANGNFVGGSGLDEGNVISGNDGNGVFINLSSSNTVQGNHIGTNATGDAPLANAGDGVVILDSTDIAIGGIGPDEGNLISGNAGHGVAISGGGNHKIQGNIIGLDSVADAPIGNTFSGIDIQNSFNNLIGGGALAGNVISGNQEGVSISGLGSTGNRILGNRIGTDGTGMAARGNLGVGISITGGASNNTVGGTTLIERNIISGNLSDGIYIGGVDTIDNVVQGNIVGLGSDGVTAVGNVDDGIEIENSRDNTIGGTVAGSKNVISGNLDDGIQITGSTGNLIQGNFIGTDELGTLDRGNAFRGVRIDGGSSGNVVGGTDPLARNVISGKVISLRAISSASVKTDPRSSGIPTTAS